jgi:hypothetical protein
MFAEEPTMIKKAAALLVILATLGIASEASARPTCTIQGLGFQTLGRMNFLYPPFDNVKTAAPHSLP